MMRLFIDGREIPVDSTDKVALVFDSSDLADVASGRTADKVTLRVPSTPETDLLFGNGGDPLSAERFNSVRHRAELTEEGVAIFAGTALLGSVTRSSEGVFYSLCIKGDTALWARSAALRKLSDAQIDFETEFTPDNIVAGWSDRSPVKFFPVDREERDTAGSSTSIFPAQSVMTTDDYWPFVSVEALVRAIFADAGYDIESKFIKSLFFRSLYMSGSYSAPDAASRKRTMDFLAGRTSDASAKADMFGRVYLTAAVKSNSVGNIVDCTDNFVYDSDGRPQATGFFTTNSCFGIGEDGIAAFRPLREAVVGFEFSIAFKTDYTILSREELGGFNTVYLGSGVSIPFRLENRFTDNRDNPQPKYSYKLAVFDMDNDLYDYILTADLDGTTTTIHSPSARVTAITMPAAGRITNMKLLSKPKEAQVYRPAASDWALYWGYVEERGETEVEINVRTPAEHLSPSSVKRFDNLFIEGAEAGMSFTLLRRTTVRPIFTATAGYGSHLTFGDVAPSDIRQCELLSALAQMFDLRFATDEATKTVRIEPYADFYSGETVDWSDRIDLDSPIVVSDASQALHERITLGYAADDAAVARFNAENATRLGRWSFECGSQAALDGEQTLLNPLFSPTASRFGCRRDAPSAWIMQVRGADDESDDALTGNFSPRIVSYAGLQPLDNGERWGLPFAEGGYPLAAFRFDGNLRTPGFTLGFEDSAGLKGLNRYHARRLNDEAQGVTVTLSLRLLPHEAAALQQFCTGEASVGSLFRLDFEGGTAGALYTLLKVDGWNPSSPSVRCTFLKTERTI